MVVVRFACLVVVLVTLSSLGRLSAWAREGQNVAPFDRPLLDRHVLVGQKQVRCFSFGHFMVKEIDAGEIGDERIAIVPLASAGERVACQAKNAAAERVIPSESWSGYFLGAKGDYIFLSAGDGVNGGLGFSVYHGTDGISIFQDSVSPLPPDSSRFMR
jgi:hypothetical protein